MRSIILFLVAACSICLRADIVTMTDGRTVEGEIVSETPTEIVIKASVGKTTIKREEIQSIEKRKSASLVAREKMAALEKSNDSGNADAWLKLAADANRAGARDVAQKEYAQVVKIDPDNAIAQKALGFVLSDGNWVAKGDLKEKAAADGAQNRAEANAPSAKEKVAAAAGVNEVTSISEKPVNCPRCNGTGIWITLECLNCNKSGKPGYKNLGDHFEMDQRCGGTGKVIGMYCALCNRTGKVLLSHLTPANGGSKQPPAGRLWCPVCNGTGVETWLPCLQCKRSRWPGYMFFGDRILECNSCGGLGKKAALDCARCNKTGLINATQTDPNKQFGIGIAPDKK